MNTLHQYLFSFRTFKIACILSQLAITATRTAAGDTLVVPQENASSPGTGVQIPFGPEQLRYQNIYNASHFREAMPWGGLITAIAFRIDESDRSSFSAAVPDLEIRMSTSPSTAPKISSVFAQNAGVDETVVFDRGNLEFSVRASPTGANPFDLRIALQRPFFYDPSQGSLSVDIFNFRSATHGLLVDSGGTGMLALAGPIGSVETVTKSALILQIEFKSVPEPSALIIIGLGALCFSQRRLLHGA